MRLDWIEARDFRNYRELSLRVPGTLTAVVGPNGHGKTNLLEALYYLCALTSPRVSADLPLVRSVERSGAGSSEPPPSSAFLRGEVETSGSRRLIEVEIRVGGSNRVQVNRTPVRRKRDLRRDVRAVFSGPDDLRVLQGDPGERRRFLDEVVWSLWPAKDTLTALYDRVLRQRNRLLREWALPGEPPDLPAWDEELIAHGCAVTAARRRATEAIGAAASEEFAALTGSSETLAVAYAPSVDAPAEEMLPDVFRERLTMRRPDEIVRKTTLVGPHRDDLAVHVQGLAARGFASHGETWGAALSLRLAQARAIAGEVGEPPVLLLDDPLSALDPVRRGRLAGTLARRGQVLMAIPDEAQRPTEASVCPELPDAERSARTIGGCPLARFGPGSAR